MKKLASIFAVSLLILSACGAEKNKDEHVEEPEKQEASHAGHDHAVGDIQEETASADVLPSFLDGQNENIRLVYQIAGHSTEILEWIPCYCGCGESAGHKSNLNCFIQEKREDGSIVWDDHGTRCLACLEIALQSAQMHKDGKSLKEIRNAIDEAYKEGYAEPTPTKMPA
ncbi:PCYCGC motif-containing (lipo)protein [Lysinibacillus sp. NPDC096418]|uniref:PCYCGC motif-containing (lipo)protein n=1 Tax=Lysinibacillus sp. NPDC096418 TaxID=3364138 RepID=UPI0037F95577